MSIMPSMGITWTMRFDCGGGCAFGTVGDYLRFGQMLLDGGRLGRKRILGRKSVELMSSDHLGTENAGSSKRIQSAAPIATSPRMANNKRQPLPPVPNRIGSPARTITKRDKSVKSPMPQLRSERSP